jgi:hypothetical protein
MDFNTTDADAEMCDELEDFLFGMLSATDVARFEQHCNVCEACRNGVQAERRMKALVAEASDIQAGASGECRLTADRKTEAGVAATAGRGRLSVAMAMSVLAACLLFCFVDGSDQSGSDTDHTSVAVQNPGDSEFGDRVRLPRIRVAEDVLGLELESGDPNVVVMMLYPMHQTTR